MVLDMNGFQIVCGLVKCLKLLQTTDFDQVLEKLCICSTKKLAQ